MEILKEIALRYHRAGLSVIPIMNDGSKKPLKGFAWKDRQTSLIEPTNDFKDGLNIAIVGGSASGNVEVLDFDLKYDHKGTLWDEWKELVNNIDSTLLKRVVVQKTPSGGYHLIYKSPVSQGNLKLANNDLKEVLIETRGNNGYFLVEPSKGYKLLQGSYTDIPNISVDDRELLFTASRVFNEKHEEVKEESKEPFEKNNISIELSPFDDYNERGDVEGLLTNFGWKYVKMAKGNRMYLRPGGTQEYSVGYEPSKRLLYVFTSSTDFINNRAYNSVGVYKILNGITDNKELADRLRKDGYGSKLATTSSPKIIKPKHTDKNTFTSHIDESEEYLNTVRNGTFKLGKSTGFDKLDNYFRFKEDNFVMINGHDNVGKTEVLCYLALLSAFLHNWNWIIYAAENKTGGIYRKLLQFYMFKKLEDMTTEEYESAKKWVADHFILIKNNDSYTYTDQLEMFSTLLKDKKYNAALIDPYNALERDESKNGNQEHSYDYIALGKMRIWIEKNHCSLYINCHCVTESLRKLYPKDHPKYPGMQMPPQKADTEGGGKFANRPNDFLTIHRMTQHPQEWMWNDIHVRKIKETETGGRQTFLEEPFRIKMVNGVGYEDEDGYNPITGEKPFTSPIELDESVYGNPLDNNISPF